MCKPVMTTRAMIDVGRKCNAACSFCYYHHLGDLTKQCYKPAEVLVDEIYAALDRGCDYIDFSGGEPMGHPEIAGLVATCTSLHMGSCIITNALGGSTTLQAVIDAGLDDLLVSMHGTAETHNAAVGLPSARKVQNYFIDTLHDLAFSYRFNCVISSYTQRALLPLAGEIAAGRYRPRIVNFINFNPHGEWGSDVDGVRKIVADLYTVEEQLNQAIPLLEGCGIGVNVRYYPMCRIAAEFRRCVCNDSHVMYDPYEWDNGIQHTEEAYQQWTRNTTCAIEWKAEPCSHCALLPACGGINKALNFATCGEYPQAVAHVKCTDPFFYRALNTLTLAKREVAYA